MNELSKRIATNRLSHVAEKNTQQYWILFYPEVTLKLKKGCSTQQPCK